MAEKGGKGKGRELISTDPFLTLPIHVTWQAAIPERPSTRRRLDSYAPAWKTYALPGGRKSRPRAARKTWNLRSTDQLRPVTAAMACSISEVS